ncbi:helix-turn-helix domain-containing protein [Demetria terragena]|uniref:helix-turn-helix domain-containing protein n=1 Tax=Demetria terragena TaxID=63959 RepID=UPI00037EFECB|nr:helix-turn-helix domain-containing protein [Demetria terragena]
MSPGEDPVDRAHLRDPTDRSHTIARYPVSTDLDALARRFWIPTWSVPPGQEAPQHVLQYPVCLIVIADDYARFYGVTSGLSETILRGDGWAVGLMLQPAAGRLVTGRSVAELRDTYVGLTTIPGFTPTVVEDVRAAMAPDPTAAEAHKSARERIEAQVRAYGPVDDEGRLVNDIVDRVEIDQHVLRVNDLCERFEITERSLQRLTRRRLGLSPKWLIRRRRLHDAVSRLQRSETDLAGLAADLGYTDQAHLTRDFRSATGLTPGRFAARFG